MKIDIDYLRFQDQLSFRKEGRQRFILDPIRRRYLVQTPEETVRQLVILYLMEERAFPKNRIAVEKMLIINGLNKRFDILVYEQDMTPFLLVECKAPNVIIHQDAFRQIAIYNMPLRSQYLLVTNGIVSYCCKMEYESSTFTFLKDIPAFPQKSSP